jgi:YopX protein.
MKIKICWRNKMKYRIWDKNSGYFIKVSDTNKHYLSPDGDIIIIDEIGFMYETDKENYIINNYAGLKDSKGYEIFEDDIVWNEYDEEYQVVIFDEGEYKLIGESHIQNLYNNLDYIDVRGNIYENLELVKGWYKKED